MLTLKSPRTKQIFAKSLIREYYYGVWECDLVDEQGLGKYNDGINYLLCVIDVFSKYLHVVPLKSKTGPSVTAAFQSILKDRRYLKT